MPKKELTKIKLDFYNKLLEKKYQNLTSSEMQIFNLLCKDPLVCKQKYLIQRRKPRSKELMLMKRVVIKLVNLISLRKITALEIEKFLDYVLESKTNMFLYILIGSIFNRTSDVFTVVTAIHNYGVNKERRNKCIYAKKILPYVKPNRKESEEISKFLRRYPNIVLWTRPEIHPATISYLQNILKVGNIKQFKI